jgi:hypothetical protein
MIFITLNKVHTFVQQFSISHGIDGGGGQIVFFFKALLKQFWAIF